MPIARAEAEAVTLTFVSDYPGALALAYRFRETTTDLYGPRTDIPQGMLGGYVPGRVVVGDRIYDGRVDVPLRATASTGVLIATLRHEVLGHYGANTFAPGDKRALIDGILAARDAPTLAPLWDDIDQRYAGEPPDIRAEEVFALPFETLEPGQHIGQPGVRERGERSFFETCIARLRPMQKADLHNIACMVAEGLHDRSRTQQTFPRPGQQFRMEEVMEPKKPLHEAVAETLIEQLRAGTAPWQKPWAPGELRLPYNASTGKEYRGGNSIWLHMQGRGDPRWMTWRQAEAAGVQVRRGERGTRIEYWKTHDEQPVKDERGRPVLDGDGQPRKVRIELERPRPFSAVVFNAAQIDGLPPLEAKQAGPEPERHARAEAILANSGASITHLQGNRAYYSPGPDRITLPARTQFASADGYYATALHELGHWTGHKSRLDRDLAHPFGSEGYAREELRAEIASLMLGGQLGIGHDPGQHAAYVASWIKALREDPREIFRACAAAEKISGHVMGFEHERQQEAVRAAGAEAVPVTALPEGAAMAGPDDPRARIAALKAERDRLWPHASEAQKATLAAARLMELTYTSNAIEGNTLTRAETELIIDKGLAVGSKPFRDYQEAVDLHKAHRRAFDLAASEKPFDEAAVLDLHRQVVAGTRDDGGVLSPHMRMAQGMARIFPRPEKLPGLMKEFGEWLSAQSATPEAAIEAHARLVEIHPFNDGNGRTGRLLMNALLVRGGYPPVVIQPEAKGAYIDALNERHFSPEKGQETWRAFMLDRVGEALAFDVNILRGDMDVQQRMAAGPEGERTRLAVPFREKDEARALGAKWDREARAWFAPDGTDVQRSGLARWLPENTRAAGRQATPEESFGAAIRDAGLRLDGPPVMDGNIHRVAVAGDHGAERSGAYAGHLEGRLPGGYIENFKTGERVNWKYEGRVEAIAPQDRERLAREAAGQAARREAATAARHEAVATIAAALWDEAPPATADHPYCAARGILRPGEHGLRVVPESVSDAAQAAGVRIARTPKEAMDLREAGPEARVFLAGDLLVPARDMDGRLWSVQSVNPAFKGFMKGGRKAGLYTVAGAEPSAWAAALDKDPALPLVLAEGYATGDAVARLMGHPVVVAFDSGNLDAVAWSLRERWPDRPLLIAADNDHRAGREPRPDGRPGVNVGLEKARETAANNRGGVMVPAFTAEDRGSDWNDYARQHGDETARKDLLRQVEQARIEAAMNAERLASLAREREAEARDDPTTSADDAKVVHERSAAHDLMARAIFGSAGVRAEAIDAIVANGMGKGRPAAAVSATLAHSNARLQDEVKEQRQTVLDGQNVSTTPQGQQAPSPAKRARRRGRDDGAEL